MKTLSVVVMAAPGRTEAHRRLQDSLEVSDLHGSGGRELWLRQGAGVVAIDHWRASHRAAAELEADLVLVLEDDALANRHLVHNIQTWRWPYDKDFGAGWLYNPGGYTKKDVWYNGPPAWHGTVGVLYPRALLGALIEKAWPAIQDGEAWDLAMSRAVTQIGKRIRVHYPAIVEHQSDVPSVIQTKSTNPQSSFRTSRGTFDRTWQRPMRHEHGIVDERGRSRL